jgi:ornithine decarboxylase
MSELPRVTPYYAVKCNPDPAILETLSALGCGFDVASRKELSQVLAMGVGSNRIVFSNPAKMPSHIAHAASNGMLDAVGTWLVFILI